MKLSSDNKLIRTKNKSNLIQLSIIELCFSKLYSPKCQKKKTIKLLSKGIRFIQEKLDIISMVKEFFNDYKIRKMIFSKVQSLIFNMNLKPELTLKNYKDKDYNIFLVKDYQQNIKPNKTMLEYLGKENPDKIIKDSVFLTYINYPLINK